MAIQSQVSWLGGRLDVIERKVDDVEQKISKVMDTSTNISTTKLTVGGVIIAALITGLFSYMTSIHLSELKEAQEASLGNRALLQQLIEREVKNNQSESEQNKRLQEQLKQLQGE